MAEREVSADELNRAAKILESLSERRTCLAIELDTFAHTVEYDAGVSSVAFDGARKSFCHDGQTLECGECGYSLRMKRQVISNGPMNINLYPVRAYEMERVDRGECEYIEPLEKKLGKIGLLDVNLPRKVLNYVTGLMRPRTPVDELGN